MTNNNGMATNLAAARLVATSAAPYMSAAVLALIPEEREDIPTLAVTASGRLLINPSFVAGLDARQLAGLLLHEALHVVLDHAGRCGTRDHLRWNMAGDLAINPTVRRIGLPIPAEGLWPDRYGWSDDLTADEYYAALSAAANNDDNDGGGTQRGDNGDGDGVACGSCGTCAHTPDSDDDDGRSEVELQRVRTAVAEAITAAAAAASAAGTVPGMLQRWAAETLAPPTVSWRDQLRRMVRSAVGHMVGAAVHVYDRPSRRQSAIGYDGQAILPRLRAPRASVAIVLDTSGSMHDDRIRAALSEIAGVLTQRADVTLVTCDSDVHTVTMPRTISDLTVIGGGGTDMTPAFAHIAAQRPRTGLIVCVTDAEFDWPPEPRRIPVLWVVVGNAVTPPYGRVVHVEERE